MQRSAQSSAACVGRQCLSSRTPTPTDDDDDGDTDSLDGQRSCCGAGKETRVQPLVQLRKDGSVRVAVRVRPALPWELARNAVTCVQTLRGGDHSAVHVTAGPQAAKKFTFDHVFSQTTTQTEVYDEALHPLLASFLQGFNVTVIAYGQTGSGKTYTMGNNMPSACRMANNVFASPPTCDDGRNEAAGDTLESSEGLIPRFLYHLFAKLNENRRNVELSVSFLEIYGQDIYDLLDSTGTQRLGRRSASLQLREDTKNGVWVQGLKEVRVSSRQEAMDQMRRGALQRITASTQMNEHSSRSHAVYTVKIVQRVSEEGYKKVAPLDKNIAVSSSKRMNKLAVESSNNDDVAANVIDSDAVIVSKLTFVDLAGSERLKKTLAEGDRMKEGIQINAGLFALGNVINALGDDRRQGSFAFHVPYRSSKLTRLLQDALGGNSRTLFIACVSSADLNADETLNTLVYANRAKNIQNKAVKNIDSRSAKLANLKAYNQLLCRELVKAVLAGLKGEAHDDMDSLVDICMASPKVVAHFGSIEQLLASAELMMAGDKRTIEARRLLSSLTSHLCELASKKKCQRAISVTSASESRPNRVERRDELLGFARVSSSAVVKTKARKLDTDEACVTTCTLEKLCRTLEIVNFAFEMLEVQREGKRLRQSLNVKRMNSETRYRRRVLLRDGLSGMIDRMQTRLSSATLTEDARRSIGCSIDVAKGKLDSMTAEIEDLKCRIATLSREQKLESQRCQKEWKEKQDQISEMREADNKTATNTLDVLIRKAEIEVRFDRYDLDSIADLLKNEEKEVAAYLDEGNDAIAFMSPLFTKQELALSQHRDIVLMIENELQNALYNEALEAFLHKELRRRTQLIHKIAQGSTACHRDEMTERMFMEKNERALKDCENSISQIREAMQAKQCQRASMGDMIDSIESLDAAKVVIRRLIIQIYAQRRNGMVLDEKEEFKQQKEIEKSVQQSLAAVKTDMDAKLEAIEARYEKDLQSTFQMVTSFDDAIRSDDQSLMHDPSGQAKAAVEISSLKERDKMLVAELAENNDEMVAMRAELDRLRASAKSAEKKEEALRVMDRCQELWQELGVNEEDQASKFQDISELLLKKCSEELESLEAAREKIQARIDDACRIVGRLESILRVDAPLHAQSLPEMAGETLLEQETYILSLQRRLSNELWHNLNARIRLSDDIRELSDALQIKSCEDFCHVAHDALRCFDTDFSASQSVELDVWKAVARNAGEAAEERDSFLERLDEGTDISRMSVQRDQNVFNTLLIEKTKRIAEVEEFLAAIRTMARKSQLSRDDIGSVIRSLLDGEDGGIDAKAKTLEAICAHLFQTGGQLDFSKRMLEVLAKVLGSLEEVQAGRSDALTFLRRIVEEAAMVTHDVALGGFMDDGNFRHFTCPLPQTPHGDQSFMDTLAAGKEILCCLSEPVENALRSLLYSMDDDFAAFGIDTNEQRMSFFMGCEVERKMSRLAILDKYVVRSCCALNASGDEDNLNIGVPERALECNDSFLSRLDPAFEKFHRTYSVSFGDSQLQGLRASIADIQEVKSAVNSAQTRLQSLRKIMAIYNKINEFKGRIAEFEANATQKDRLFGNSHVLLEEERFRKMAAKHYPNLLAALRKEVSRWLENEGGEYDLSVLGENLKNLLLDMMNTNTDLMHLDLGVVGRASKQLLTPNSSSFNL